jgi:hypothetical protein
MKKYLLSDADRQELARILSKERSAPPPNPIQERAKFQPQEGDTYYALPPCETGIPAADWHTGAPVAIGIQCCLFRRTPFTVFDADKQQHELEQMFDAVGHPVRVTVFNYTPTDVIQHVPVHKLKDGTWITSASEFNLERFGGRPGSGTSTTLPPRQRDASCEGDCFFQADGDGVWEAPIGGCRNGTTTSTTTGTSTTGSPTTTFTARRPGTTRYPDNVPQAELFKCTNTKCLLVCKEVTTTGTPTTHPFQVPAPVIKYRYELSPDSDICPAGCTCYGLGDPCYLVEGELASSCIGTLATSSTTTTTTPSPDATACEEAEFIFGTVPPNFMRKARKQGADNEWEVCQPCDEANGYVPLFPTGDFYRRHDWRTLATVYESPCVLDPNFNKEVRQIPRFYVGRYRAFHIDQQREFWGWQIPGVQDDPINGRFTANWFRLPELGSKRPSVSPPFWIYPNSVPLTPEGYGYVFNDQKGLFEHPPESRLAGTTVNGFVLYDIPTNTYIFYVTAYEDEQQFNCDLCSRAPSRRKWEYQGPSEEDPNPTTTGSPTSTTSTTTTTPPCGCERPSFCGKPYECIRTACVRGGNVVDGNYGTTRQPQLPCFPDSTTTTQTPTSTTPNPGTTNMPGQCYDSYGTLCNCTPSQPPQTQPPSGSTCPPGYSLVSSGDICVRPFCVEVRPPGQPGTTSIPLPCTGLCDWIGVASSGSSFAWKLVTNGCALGIGGGCSCIAPTSEPGACGATAVTGCFSPEPPLPPPRPPRPPCDCCTNAPTTTTSDPCPTGICRYTSTVSNTWVLRESTCPNRCACPPASSVNRSISGACDTITVPCGFVFPPPPTTTPPTTTPGPGACCLRTVWGTYACIGTVSDNANCQSYVTNYPHAYESATFYPGRNCSGPQAINCSEQNTSTTSTTPAPLAGTCCAVFAIGTGAPTMSCFTAQSPGMCASFGGTFLGPGVDCATNPCAAVTSTTTTTSTTSTTTTTANPTVRCCYGFASPAVCFSTQESNLCIQQGGYIVATCADCRMGGPGSTTSTTTTTLPPGVTTTPNPCNACFARQCGCLTGPEVICPPGQTFNCSSCSCGTPTTSPPTAPPPPL